MSDDERGGHADEESRSQGAVATATHERDGACVEDEIERRDRVVEEASSGVPPELGAGDLPPDPLRDRLVLPLLLPIGSFVAVLIIVLNLSRVFLASGEDTSVIVGVIVSVGVLLGAAAISASPRLRSSTLTMTLAGLMVLIMSAGLISLGPSEEKKAGGGGYQQPTGAPVAILEVDAGPGGTTSFQSKQFGPLPTGIIQIDYIRKSGSHTLAFTDPKLTGFLLKVPGKPSTGKVKLTPGTYTIYCTIPGHRAAGMQATVTISA